MRVYRLALRNNPTVGCFASGHARQASDVAHAEGVFDPYQHPNDALDCRTDNAYTNGRRTVCGFQSLEVYRIWFVTPTVRAALFKDGDLVMRLYEVPDHLVDVGMVQVRFNLDDAVLIREATPEEIA